MEGRDLHDQQVGACFGMPTRMSGATKSSMYHSVVVSCEAGLVHYQLDAQIQGVECASLC